MNVRSLILAYCLAFSGCARIALPAKFDPDCRYFYGKPKIGDRVVEELPISCWCDKRNSDGVGVIERVRKLRCSTGDEQSRNGAK